MPTTGCSPMHLYNDKNLALMGSQREASHRLNVSLYSPQSQSSGTPAESQHKYRDKSEVTSRNSGWPDRYMCGKITMCPSIHGARVGDNWKRWKRKTFLDLQSRRLSSFSTKARKGKSLSLNTSIAAPRWCWGHSNFLYEGTPGGEGFCTHEK